MMDTLRVLNLHLEAPLFYARDETLQPFSGGPFQAERLFYFELDPAQYLSIDPDQDAYLGRLIAGGALVQPSSAGHEPPSFLELPRGQYLFAQREAIPDREGYIQMAVEVQKEGLWRRMNLDRTLYLRYLYEDEKAVTQVFRPLAKA